MQSYLFQANPPIAYNNANQLVGQAGLDYRVMNVKRERDTRTRHY
ncbi:hypothetical protein [Priestia taiwanensis]|nr:hypothetical protein [Priestia taiwanensis]MBM7361640.1 hypothetical protein [Priestia taiwanensis]